MTHKVIMLQSISTIKSLVEKTQSGIFNQKEIEEILSFTEKLIAA
ncbi:MAG: hypothetical protein ABI723_21255 [Bacteroidia bacterium]